MAERQWAGRPKNDAMSGAELRERIKAQGWTFTAAAAKLGLTLAGLDKQMRGETGVSRQTRLLLELQEQVHNAETAPKPARRRAR